MTNKPPAPQPTNSTATVTIEGALERVIFTNADSSWSAAVVATGDGPVRVVGNLFGAQLDDNLKITGSWRNDARYGWQLQIDTITLVVPATETGIRIFLGSGKIPGIKRTLADRIVDVFGADTIDVLDTQPQRLREVPGIGTKKLAQITQAWAEQQAVRDAQIFLAGLGVTAGHAGRIYAAYQARTVEVVTSTPYRLIEDVDGFGFARADEIAKAVGIAHDSLERISAGLLHQLGEAATAGGDCYLPAAALTTRASGLLGVPTPDVAATLEVMIKDGLVVAEELSEHDPRGQVRTVWLPVLHRTEAAVARRLKELLDTGNDRLRYFAEADWNSTFAQLTARIGITLAAKQRDAVRLALTSRIAILTGGPGCGKTTSVNSVLAVAAATDATVVLAAPTGKAARRLSELTGRQAYTIHRLLGLRPGESPLYDADNPLQADLVVVDEASMIDIYLAHRLLQAVPKGAHLLLVGDADQLPSVGPGQVLRDLIASDRVPYVTLTQIFRQDEQSGIVVNAHRINHGQRPHTGNYTDFYWIPCEDPVTVAATVVATATGWIPQQRRHHPRDEVQVLTPTHRGEAGTAALNARLQNILTPTRAGLAEYQHGDRMFRVGDKVIVTKNNYTKGAAGVFNGTSAIITGIDPQAKKLLVRTEERETVDYSFDEANQLAHAYALTIHKSQGSEYQAVVIPITTGSWIMLQRNLLYTAVTRARKLAILIGSERALMQALRTLGAARNTGLAARLQGSD